MKKAVITLFLFFVSLKSLLALPVGNPSVSCLFCDPLNPGFFDVCCGATLPSKKFGVSVGYWGDFVFNRHLETVTNRKVDFSRITTNAGFVAVSFCDIFSLFTTIGVSKFSFNTSLRPFNLTNPSPRFEFQSDTSFSWSFGGYGTLWNYKCFSLGVSGQYFSSNPKARVLFVRADVDVLPDESSHRHYSEWQIGAALSYNLSCYIIPYIAIKYSRAFWDFHDQVFLVTDTFATIPNLRNSKNWGYAIGATLAPFACEKIAVTVEGRFADETAVHVKGQLCF